MKTVNQTEERGEMWWKFSIIFLQNLVNFLLENKESKIKYAPFYFYFFHLCKKIAQKKELIYEVT